MFGIKREIKRIIQENRIIKDSVKEAKKLGVNISEDCRLIDWPNWGSEPYLISIGKHVTISCECMFITHDGGTWVFRDEEKYRNVKKYGKIIIGNNCFIGARCTIMPNVVIGDNSVVGACSLVNKSIPSGEVWGGVPAHFICKTSEYAEKSLRENVDYNTKEFSVYNKDIITMIADGYMRNKNERK